MDFIQEPNRIYQLDNNGKLIAEITFPNITPGRVNLNHTFVDPSLRGQGIASQLVEKAYETIRSQHKKAKVSCPYAIHWFKEHPAYSDILL